MSLFIHHGSRSIQIDSDPNIKQVPTDQELVALIDRFFASDGPIHMQVQVSEPDHFLGRLAEQLNWIEAAGGLIQNDSGQFLLIYRRGHWDLPKGKIDFGETPIRAAFREIKEETGLKMIAPVDELPSTYHCYSWDGKRILKKTHWFRFSCPSDQPLYPQTEEEIEEARWMLPTEIKDIKERIYPSLWPVLEPFTD